MGKLSGLRTWRDAAKYETGVARYIFSFVLVTVGMN